MVTVTVSETYDLSTKVDKMTLIGIHTPQKALIQKSYPGLLMNSKYVKISKIDVALAAVSTLPISPDQVGLDADDIAPQDMMNPILYKAVSNDSMSQIEARLHGLVGTVGEVNAFGSMVTSANDGVTGLTDDFGVYYSLLSNRDGFKVAHVQQGLTMHGLVPLVFEKYYNVGTFRSTSERSSVDSVEQDATPGSDVYPVIESDGNGGVRLSTRIVQSMRGRPHPMPAFPTTYVTSVAGSTSAPASQKLQNGMGDGQPHNAQVLMPDILPVYCAMIIMPPAKRTVMYYRLVVRCTLEFLGVRPMSEIASFASLNTYYANEVYHTDYTEQSKIMESSTDMVDVQNANIEKIMEGR